MPDHPSRVAPDIRRISLRRLKAGSFFKLVFISTSATLCPLILVCGACALFGLNTISVSGRYLTGFSGLLAAILMAPIVCVVFSVFFSFVGYLGLHVWGHFRPVTLEYVPAPGDGT